MKKTAIILFLTALMFSCKSGKDLLLLTEKNEYTHKIDSLKSEIALLRLRNTTDSLRLVLECYKSKVSEQSHDKTNAVLPEPLTVKPEPVQIKTPNQKVIKKPNTTGTFKDKRDGQTYRWVKIGTQTWMIDNLRATKYRNKDSIPNVTDVTSWPNLTTGAYCNYNNDASYANRFGCLYNWYAVSDNRNLAPVGWHVASDAEWSTLESYLIENGYNFDGSVDGNHIAKSLASTTDWSTSSKNGSVGNDLSKNNESGFNALPGGYRIYNGSFANMRYHAFWWTSTESGSDKAIYRYLHFSSSTLSAFPDSKNWGRYIRCVKD